MYSKHKHNQVGNNQAWGEYFIKYSNTNTFMNTNMNMNTPIFLFEYINSTFMSLLLLMLKYKL